LGMGRYLEASKTMGIFIQDGRTKIGFFLLRVGLAASEGLHALHLWMI
jgi:hypothetical protein